jgi:DNA-binding response OmpR family regulator
MSRTVLVVDDDEEIRHMLRLLLHLSGYEVDEAVDGVDALNKIRHCRPDIVVLDVMMPNMDGLTLCKLLRQEPETARMPIVMLSGKITTQAIDEGLQAGANRYLVKPTGLDILTEVLDELLQDALAEQRSSQFHR